MGTVGFIGGMMRALGVLTKEHLRAGKSRDGGCAGAGGKSAELAAARFAPPLLRLFRRNFLATARYRLPLARSSWVVDTAMGITPVGDETSVSIPGGSVVCLRMHTQAIIPFRWRDECCCRRC